MSNIQQLQEALGYISWRLAIIGQHIQDIPDADCQIINSKVGDILNSIKQQRIAVMILAYEAKEAHDKVHNP